MSETKANQTSEVSYSRANLFYKIKNWPLQNKQVLVFAFVSLVFTVWFCRFIFSPSSEMLGIDFKMGTADAYATLAAMSKDVAIAQSGHFPGGVFWLPDFYGGSLATWFHIGAIPDLSLSSYLMLNSIFNDLVLSLKVLAFISLLIAQFCSYKLSKALFSQHLYCLDILGSLFFFCVLCQQDKCWSHPICLYCRFIAGRSSLIRKNVRFSK